MKKIIGFTPAFDGKLKKEVFSSKEKFNPARHEAEVQRQFSLLRDSALAEFKRNHPVRLSVVEAEFLE